MRQKRHWFLQKRSSQQGAILAVTLIILVCLLVIVIPLLFKLIAQFRTTEKFYKSIVALNLAEAGVERAIWELNRGLVSPWQISFGTNGISLWTTLNDFPEGKALGDIDIRVDPSESPLYLKIESTGKVPWSDGQTIDRTVRVVVERKLNSMFDFGIFASGRVDLGSDVEIDSYNSKVALYDVTKRGHNGRVGTNESATNSIFLGNNGKIYGNAGAGFGTDPTSLNQVINTNDGILEGTKFILSDVFSLTPVYPPLNIFWSIKGDYTYNDGANVGSIDQSSSGLYTSFLLDQGKVRVNGNVILFVVGEFKMKEGTTLEISQNSSLRLYLGGTFTQWQFTAVNNLTKDPTKLLILGTDMFTSDMVWNANADLYGAIYVPKAEVHYDSTSDLYGGIICSRLYIAPNVRIHYDEALKDVGIFQGGLPKLLVKSWQEKH